jgi:hypothetical protein
MGHAWPRYLPQATTEALAHALLIEAHAILVAALGEGQGSLIEAHDRAACYAGAHYTPQEIRGAWSACAAAAGNDTDLLHAVVTRSTAGAAIEARADQRLPIAIAA